MIPRSMNSSQPSDPIRILRAKPDHFEGDINIVNILVQLTAATIPIVGMLIAQRIRAKRHIRVKLNGIEVRGENLDKIEAFLTKMALPTASVDSGPAKKGAKAASGKSKRKSK